MEVLKDFMVGEQNFIMADRDGNIGYMAPARIPIRNWDLRSYPPYLPLPGDGSFEWEGYYDYIWVPQVINPRKGFIVTANNDPLGTTLDGDLFNDPFYLGNFYDFGARAYRITELITEGIASQRKFTPEVIRTIQWDVYSILAEEFLPHLLSLKPIVCNDTGSLPCQAMKILEGWDRINRADSPAPTLFHLWLAHLIDQIFADDIPLFYVLMDLVGQRELQVFARVLKKIFEDPATLPYDFVDLRTTPQREGLEEIMLLAFQKTLEHSQRAFTDDRGNPLPPSDWQWGKMHTIFFQHLAFSDESRGPLPYHGGKGVVDASDYAFFTNEGVAGPPVVQRAGPNMRLIMKMTAEGWETYNILPGGASGDPRSPHYDDQLFLWLQGENRRIPYTREEVERSAIESRIYPQGFPEVR
jgi:penicillin amidase